MALSPVMKLGAFTTDWAERPKAVFDEADDGRRESQLEAARRGFEAVDLESFCHRTNPYAEKAQLMRRT